MKVTIIIIAAVVVIAATAIYVHFLIKEDEDV
jgi:flagellar basal body-associated protein FliL